MKYLIKLYDSTHSLFYYYQYEVQDGQTIDSHVQQLLSRPVFSAYPVATFVEFEQLFIHQSKMKSW